MVGSLSEGGVADRRDLMRAWVGGWLGKKERERDRQEEPTT